MLGALRFRNWSLNRRLVAVVILALLPVALTSVWQGLSARRHLDTLAADHLVANALATSLRQAQPISVARRTLTRLARDPSILSASKDCSERIKSMISPGTGVVNYARSDERGNALCSALPFEQGTNFSTQSWWQPGIEARRMTLSAPTVGQISKRPIIIAMYPLYDSAGNSRGAITAGIDMGWMQQSLLAARIPRAAIAGVSDRDGKIIMSAGEKGLDWIDLTQSEGRIGMANSADGQHWRYAVAPLFDDELYVIFAEREDTLMDAARLQWIQSLILPVAAMVFASLAVWWGLQKFVLLWLEKLSEKARQIARGEYVYRPDRFKRAAPEIAEFAHTLHDMAVDIGERDANLRAALDTSYRLAREVNHRVKNNLQIVLSLLNLQSAQVEHPEAKKILEHTRNRMNAVALAQRLTYDISEDGEHGTVDGDRLMNELAAQLQSNMVRHHADLTMDARIGAITVDQAIPLALFTVEAVSNAVDHAFPEGAGGTIAITLTGRDQCGELTIVDSGKGFDTGAAQSRIGIALMGALAAQLGGTHSVESRMGSGSALRLTFGRAGADQA